MSSASLTPRKAPRQARAVATVEAIAQAATQLLRENGLAAMTTNAVAARAGVSIGSLYQYFPNRDALMVELIRREQRGHVERVRAALVLCEELDLEATVRLLVRAAMGHHRADALLASAIDHEEARLPVDAIIAETLAEGGALLMHLFSRFRDEIGPLDPARAARTLPALVRSVVDAWANLAQSELEVAEEEAVQAVLGYLCIYRRLAA
ncbi:MAG: TetR/AcrR family transcriptional regulator [Sphingomonadales bacterium]|nr:TetR/AcrR family transcriptional regulator [Sphingomonadales bacterium]